MAGDLAEMADLLDQLGRLCSTRRRRACARERCSPTTSSVSLRDQVARLDIDCLVVGPAAAGSLVASLLANPPADVRGPARAPGVADRVVAMRDEGDDAPAVVEVAAEWRFPRACPCCWWPRAGVAHAGSSHAPNGLAGRARPRGGGTASADPGR